MWGRLLMPRMQESLQMLGYVNRMKQIHVYGATTEINDKKVNCYYRLLVLRVILKTIHVDISFFCNPSRCAPSGREMRGYLGFYIKQKTIYMLFQFLKFS